MVSYRCACIALTTLFLSGLASAQCRLTGNVTSDGLPLPDATVALSQLRGQDPVAHVSTRMDGSYEFIYPQFSSGLRTMFLRISASGHTPDERQLFRHRDSQCLQLEREDVVLERIQTLSNTSSDTPAAGEQASTLGLTIFISPYEMYGDDSGVISERFNRDLPKIIHHRILAYQSRLKLPGSLVDISVDVTKEALNPAQGERMRRVGQQLNALGMIAGDGEIIMGNDGEQKIDMESVFRTIPVYQDNDVILQPIHDLLTARHSSPGRIASQLRDEWGKQAILSYVLKQLSSRVDGNAAELDELDDLLIGVRNTMTQDDRLLLPLEALRSTIAQERVK